MKNFTFFKNSVLFHFSCFVFSLFILVNAPIGIVRTAADENNGSVLNSNPERQFSIVDPITNTSFSIGTDMNFIKETLGVSIASARVFLLVSNVGFNGVPVFKDKENDGYGLMSDKKTVGIHTTIPTVSNGILYGIAYSQC
jgi:hypothetical protein